MKNTMLLPALMLLLPLASTAQVYVDPGTTAALYSYAKDLENGQEKIEKEQNKLQKAQAFIATQLAAANEIQNKIYKGLSEVSGTLQNGMQLKRIREELKECLEYYREVNTMIQRHPQFAPFAHKAMKGAYEQALQLGTEIISVTTGGKDQLATAGDRYMLLSRIESKIVGLKLWFLTMQISMQNVERMGIIRALNPFQTYIDTDKDIIQNILERYKNF
ncbi:hypothetical protein [Capnocytophaga leadbetteri]|jgi:hypothetical protein|uniref:hypothetical protein n=1 Tax=Capnocytophaga leadbetteri TaxID=327575 RepID=UPI0028E78931|nr:hypothetical protein [Capnocytophaga leadbetteri]